MLIYLSRQNVRVSWLLRHLTSLRNLRILVAAKIGLLAIFWIIFDFPARRCMSDSKDNLISFLTIRDAQELQHVPKLQSPLQLIDRKTNPLLGLSALLTSIP